MRWVLTACFIGLCVTQQAMGVPQEERIELPDSVVAQHNIPDANTAVAGVYGTITAVGSDTLATLMALWAEEFKRQYPHVKFQIQATGSSTASQALTQGTANLGPMSRELTVQEINRFTRKFGYPPTVVKVAVDAIAIFVEQNNPLRQISSEQVDGIFSVTRFCGGVQNITNWSQLDIAKFGNNRKITAFGRNSSSGTYDLFKQQALCNGDYKANVNELSGSASIVRSVASSIGGIGYAALGFRNDNVRPLSIGVRQTGANQGSINSEQHRNKITYIAPTPENITGGKYPFWRYLYIVVNKDPEKSLPLIERTFLAFILSEQGQMMVKENGYYPIQRSVNKQQINILF